MKTKYRVGQHIENDILLRCTSYLNFHAEIIYDRGAWILHNLDENNPIRIGTKDVTNDIYLAKDDIIKIGKQKIYWNDYLHEGETQEMRMKDLFSFHGRVSRANFRALSLLAVGVSSCVFFLPVLILKLVYKWSENNVEISFESTENLMPSVYLICYPIIIMVMLILSIKRIRDTGSPIWKLFVPIYNLKLLYFEYSKK